MKDEWNNECPYDFKNIKFTKNSNSIYTFGGTTDSTNQITPPVYNNTIKPYIFNKKYELGFNTFGTLCINNYLDFNCKNGFFPCEVYNLDRSIALEILPRLLYFRDKTTTYPGGFDSLEEWRQELNNMCNEFYNYIFNEEAVKAI